LKTTNILHKKPLTVAIPQNCRYFVFMSASALTEIEQQLLKVVHDNGEQTISTLSGRMGKQYGEVMTLCDSLETRKFLEMRTDPALLSMLPNSMRIYKLATKGVDAVGFNFQ
jgi:hypothetical protein